MNDDKRKKRLQELLQQIDGGVDVSLRDLKNVLTSDEYLEFNEICKHEKDKHTEPKPPEIKKYELLLKKAMLADSKCDVYSKKIYKRSEVVQKRLVHYRDITFHNVFEFLQELQSTKNSLWIWMDRDIRFDAKNSPVSVSELPRLVTSRSHSVQCRGFKEKLSKRDIKTQVLKDSLNSIENKTQTMDVNEQFEEIRKMIKGTVSKSKFEGFKM